MATFNDWVERVRENDRLLREYVDACEGFLRSVVSEMMRQAKEAGGSLEPDFSRSREVNDGWVEADVQLFLPEKEGRYDGETGWWKTKVRVRRVDDVFEVRRNIGNGDPVSTPAEAAAYVFEDFVETSDDDHAAKLGLED